MQADRLAMNLDSRPADPSEHDPRVLDANAPAEGRVRIPGSNRFTRVRDLRFSRRAGIAVLLVFSALAGLVAVLSMLGIMSSDVSSLLLWALLGLYFGFGILIVVYRMISRLE